MEWLGLFVFLFGTLDILLEMISISSPLSDCRVSILSLSNITKESADGGIGVGETAGACPVLLVEDDEIDLVAVRWFNASSDFGAAGILWKTLVRERFTSTISHQSTHRASTIFTSLSIRLPIASVGKSLSSTK